MPNNSPDSDIPVGPHDALHDGYVSALSGRYASREMQRLWSDRHKFQTWRQIWLAVAEAQYEMGLPVTKEQVEELRANLDVTDADIALAKKYEAELRHDVMSHVHAWGDRCPKARGIIHLGMTSQDINDNCELLIHTDAIELISKSVERTVAALGHLADRTKHIPTLGFTHYQPAQPVTVGRRAAQWCYELWECSDPVLSPPLRGLRGATGTQASFLRLFDNDPKRVAELEARFLAKLIIGRDQAPFGFDETYLESEIESIRSGKPLAMNVVSQLRGVAFPLTGQTYPRYVDAQTLAALATIASVLHKVATDIRLLCNLGEVSEPFAQKQIGSSAMPYKRNPMRCERVCGLARFVWNLVPNAYDTAATQWLERTLDDSSNRRLTLPQACLATEACLNIMQNVASGLVVHEKVIARNLQRELPFLATEAIMMRAVALGRDRQDVHEAIRQHAMEAKHRMVEGDGENDLVERLMSEPLLEGVDIEAELVPERHIGLSIQQTERFLAEIADLVANADDSTGQDLSV